MFISIISQKHNTPLALMQKKQLISHLLNISMANLWWVRLCFLSSMDTPETFMQFCSPPITDTDVELLLFQCRFFWSLFFISAAILTFWERQRHYAVHSLTKGLNRTLIFSATAFRPDDCRVCKRGWERL